MTIVSMTGFAESAGSHDGLRWRWEAKSVNGRGLDLRLRTPPGFDALEPPARMLAAERFRRGNLPDRADGGAAGTARAGLKIDPVALASAVQARARSRRRNRSGAGARRWPPGAQGRDRAGGGGRARPGRPRRIATPPILKSLATAFDALARARANEGAKLAAAFVRADRRDRASDGRSRQAWPRRSPQPCARS